MSTHAKLNLIGIDLMPKPIKLAVLRRNRLRTWSAILTVAAALASIPMAYELLNQHRLGKATAANHQRAQLLREAKQSLLAVQSEAQSQADQIAFSDALRAKRNWSDLLALMADAEGHDVWLVSIQSAIKPARQGSALPVQPTAGEAVPSGEVVLEGPQCLILEGYAPDHARLYVLMADLRDRGNFEDVDLSRAGVETFETGTAVRFRLECQW
jgi:hypothetical protein